MYLLGACNYNYAHACHCGSPHSSIKYGEYGEDSCPFCSHLAYLILAIYSVTMKECILCDNQVSEGVDIDSQGAMCLFKPNPAV